MEDLGSFCAGRFSLRRFSFTEGKARPFPMRITFTAPVGLRSAERGDQGQHTPVAIIHSSCSPVAPPAVRITRCGTAETAMRTGGTPVPHPCSDRRDFSSGGLSSARYLAFASALACVGFADLIQEHCVIR